MEGDGEGSFGWGWGEGAIACADVSILPPPNLTSSRIESAPKVLSKTLKTDGMASMNLQQMFFPLILRGKGTGHLKTSNFNLTVLTCLERSECRGNSFPQFSKMQKRPMADHQQNQIWTCPIRFLDAIVPVCTGAILVLPALTVACSPPRDDVASYSQGNLVVASIGFC